MKTILVIEDDETLCQVIADFLHMEGFNTITAADGGEGLEKAKTYSPHLILCDLIMPTMSGYEVLDALKADAALSQIPVIIMTASIHTENIAVRTQIPPQRVFIKPFRVGQLLTQIKALLSD